MKKGLLSVLIGVGILVFLTSEVLYHTGSPGGKTGSPGDGNATCTQCHTGTANTVSGWITSNIPGSGYIPGQTYTITATGTHTGVVYFGFELTAENLINQKIGTFLITNANETKLVNNGKAVTHTQNGINPSGNTKSWSMNWTAPAAGTGNVTFYAAFNAANGNGNTSGDVIYKSTLSVVEGSPLNADFTANPTTVCPGGSVVFTDLSTGNPNQWQWTFNGGTPASSTQQNPSVIYNTPGTYSVTLWVSNGSTNDQTTKTNYITVLPAAPPVPGTPAGEDQFCLNPPNSQYTTSGSSGASSYSWQIVPANAGIVTGSGTTVTVNWSDTFTGTANITVKALNTCGESAYSSPLMITISSLPVAYNVTGGGSYCEDGGGLEIGLDGSQAGVQYELLNDLSSTGIIVTGTGFAISFGTVTQAGTYSVSAIDPSTACENLMSNTVDVEIIPLPVVYPVGGGGAYCFGTNGSTITLSGSQLGHTYELYLEGQPTGTVANGTGNAISFGNITAVGTYTVIAMENTLSCENTMDGSVEVSVAFPPEMAAIPQGPIAVDLFSTFESEYSTDGSLGADEYEWLLEPLEAGSTSSIDLTTVRVTWNPEFLGEVTLRVRGVNECGPGDWSEALLITVYNTVGFEDGTEAMDVRISPNPGSGMFYLNFAGQPSEDVDVSVMNLLGETVFSKSGLSVDGDFTERIDLQGVPGGIYMLRVESRSGTVVEKFIIQ